MQGTAGPRRRGELGDVRLLRTVHRLNQMIRPDVVLLLGDLIDDRDAPDALERLRGLKSVVDLIEAPGYHATRPPHDMRRMVEARNGHDGPIVALQHVPVMPAGATDCRYGYTNADEIVRTMEAQAVTLAVSGHEHAGAPLVRRAGSSYLCVPALCEAPFPSTVVTLDDEFMAVLQRFVHQGIHVLAHPFRIYRRAKVRMPEHLYEPVARLLKASGVAAEVNFHTITPDPAFFRLCIDRGVKLTFGGDAHNRYEVGEFAPHLAFVRNCGFDGDLRDILAQPVVPPARG